MIIGLAGKKGSGKNTAALALQKRGFTVVAFADPLKNWISVALDISRSELEYIKDYEFNRSLTMKEIYRLTQATKWELTLSLKQKFNLWKNLLFRNFSTYREIMQYIATDIFRKENPNFFCDIMIFKLERYQNVVITDVRFPEERELVRAFNGYNILVYNPSTPEEDEHSSENSLGSLDEYDATVVNDGTITDLHLKVAYLTKLRDYNGIVV